MCHLASALLHSPAQPPSLFLVKNPWAEKTSFPEGSWPLQCALFSRGRISVCVCVCASLLPSSFISPCLFFLSIMHSALLKMKWSLIMCRNKSGRPKRITSVPTIYFSLCELPYKRFSLLEITQFEQCFHTQLKKIDWDLVQLYVKIKFIAQQMVHLAYHWYLHSFSNLQVNVNIPYKH